jgi:hypothetical protein
VGGSTTKGPPRSAGPATSCTTSVRSRSPSRSRSAGRRRGASPDGGTRPARIHLAADGGALAPFAAAGSRGNDMMAARRELSEASAALGPGGGSRGLALAVAPGGGRLEPLGAVALEVVAFTSMVGTYVDTLCVQVRRSGSVAAE